MHYVITSFKSIIVLIIYRRLDIFVVILTMLLLVLFTVTHSKALVAVYRGCAYTCNNFKGVAILLL